MAIAAPSLSPPSSLGRRFAHNTPNRLSTWRISIPHSRTLLLRLLRHRPPTLPPPHRRHRPPLLLLLIASASAPNHPLPSLSEQLSANPDDDRNWKEARIPLLNLGLTESDADVALAKSFGWIHSPYWGQEKAKSMPDSRRVQKTLSFLQGLGLSDEDLVAFLKKFPEALGCEVEDEMEKNVKILEKEWGISGNTLKNLLRRNPKSLGYNVDCKGDCIAQCTRCWVRF